MVGVVARPDLCRRLEETVRVATVSAPAGSGKSMLLRSWVELSGSDGRVAWVTVGHEERDPQRFWLSVVGALRRTIAGARLVNPASAAPEADGWALVERLLTSLDALQEMLWLVVDDLHELAPAALRQLELLVLRAPADLRFVLASRHDVRLGLHRLRLEGELLEIRAPDLRFSLSEARELFTAAGLSIPDAALSVLHERTEGWAAGLRMAAMALVGHPDPQEFAARFSGSERTVAEYLLAEVLDRQSEEVRRFLLRTSILEWVNGELAESLVGGGSGVSSSVSGERVLQDLERAGAFVIALDVAGTRFRYHAMFADLLVLELRRTAPGELPDLHRIASTWFAAHGHPLEAIGHAQAAHDWDRAAQLLVSYWPALHLNGQDQALHELLAAFPATMRTGDAELAALAAADELAHGSLKATGRYLALGEAALASVPVARRGRAQLLLSLVRLLAARQRGDLAAEIDQARRLASAASSEAGHAAIGEELRAVALISLGYANGWTAGPAQTRHLDDGIALARRIGRPYLEFTGLAYRSAIEAIRLAPEAQTSAAGAIELAELHGWTAKTAVGVAGVALAGALAWQGRLDEAEAVLQRADMTVRPETEAVASLAALFIRGQLQLARGRVTTALGTFQDAEALAGRLPASHPFPRLVRAWTIRTLIRLGEFDEAGQALAEIDRTERTSGLMRVVAAMLSLAQNDPRGALGEIRPALDATTQPGRRAWLVEAFLLQALALDSTGDVQAAAHALEHALEHAKQGNTLLWFMLHPVSHLLDEHGRRHPAHSGLIAQILAVSAGRISPARAEEPRWATPALSESEIRILRYLPTNLTAPQIGNELSVSRNTVKTHMRSLYAKLETHSRAETVARARELGLLAASTLAR